MTRSMTIGSMFPPDNKTTVLPTASIFSARIAATPTAPAGSTTSFARSSNITNARAMSSSLTVTTSSTVSLMMSKLSFPGRATAMPSAMVGFISIDVGSPAASDGGYAAALADCTPMTRIVRPSTRACCFIALATPEISPPPPIGTMTVSTSGTCSSISRPTVPCPAMTSALS